MFEKIPTLQEFLEVANFVNGKMFSCFTIDFLEVKHNYVVEKEEDNYIFKYFQSSIEDDKEQNINAFTMSEQNYISFLANIFRITKDWKKTYLDSESEEIQWKIEFDNNVYYGGKLKPSNYRIVQNFIEKSFMENKYDVDPKNNIPREVYGIPRPFDED